MEGENVIERVTRLEKAISCEVLTQNEALYRAYHDGELAGRLAQAKEMNAELDKAIRDLGR